MLKWLCGLFFCLFFQVPLVLAQGTTPFALTQQFDKSGNGSALAGALLYFCVAGTVATPQDVYGNVGLTQPLPNPITADASGRIGVHYLAAGNVHVRLTDASGVVQIDATLATLGVGGGGGGGGGVADASSVASSGDIKFRISGETLTGWVRLNGQTIGAVASGASERASNDTQNLYVYLWSNCDNTKCPVTGGRGTTALADFNANKQLTLPDMRGRAPVGRDCMGATCSGRLVASIITSGGTDGIDTPGAFGGLSTQTASTTIGTTNLPATITSSVTMSASQFNHAHTLTAGGVIYSNAGTNQGSLLSSSGNVAIGANSVATSTMTGNFTGSATFNGGAQPATSNPFSNMPPFVLGTFFMKL